MMAQTVKILPEIQETLVWSLGQEDPLDKGMTTHTSILARRIPWAESLASYTPRGHKGSDTRERLTGCKGLCKIIFLNSHNDTRWGMQNSFYSGSQWGLETVSNSPIVTQAVKVVFEPRSTWPQGSGFEPLFFSVSTEHPVSTVGQKTWLSTQ